MNDILLRFKEVNSRESLVLFLANLGYDTDNRGTLPDSLLSPDAAQAVLHFELTAQAFGELTILLIEARSITAGLNRQVQAFTRDRPGYYLAILASPDYSRVEIALLSSQELPRVQLRGRSMSADRQRRLQQFLRGLTCTEADSKAQHDKLQRVFARYRHSEEYFDNRALFADHYLKHRLSQQSAQWSESVLAPLTRLTELLAPLLERGTRDQDWHFDAINSVLGHPEAALDDTSADGATSGLEARDSVTILRYGWDRLLDAKDPLDSVRPEENPVARIAGLFDAAGAPDWIILTNGRLWRLYSRAAHSRATNYYEVDLPDALAEEEEQAGGQGLAFRYFWLFFRAAAFAQQPDSGKSFLTHVADESKRFAKELGERLKDRVFLQVFPQLARGFLEHSRQQGSAWPPSEADLQDCFAGTLTLLYRLLFLLYAEARDLLPIGDGDAYLEASLLRLKEAVAEQGGTIGMARTIADDLRRKKLAERYQARSYTLYDRLSELFAVIDKGDAGLNVPQYNGGLFDTAPEPEDPSLEARTAQWLQQHKVPDSHLALALDLLARDSDEKRKDLVFIDYKSLGVRQLGSIYEGLLEFKLRIAGERLGVRKVKQRDVYAAWAELSEREQARCERDGTLVEAGQAYLENDKRERKASGSYYTPDHIVKYIVEHAVGPVLEEKLEALRSQLRPLEQEFQRWRQANQSKPSPQDEAVFWNDARSRDFVDSLFDVKVLDPAMGSGHFLVEAVDFITDKLLAFLASFPSNPVTSWHLPQMRREIIAGVEQQGVSVEARRLTDVNLLKRHVLKRCIFGVDLNPMAVELAKVSLWLDCFTLGAPLSFLDHHLRCGNSLIGVTVDQVRQKMEGGVTLFSSRFQGLASAVETMVKVGDQPDLTPAQASDSKRQYMSASAMLAPLKLPLDIYTSRWFGNPPLKQGRGKTASERDMTIEFLDRADLSGELLKPGADLEQVATELPEEWRRLVRTALDASARERFFHWELEFPEVFYRHGERVMAAGFDAVVGNPPYVRQEGLGGLKDWLADGFASVYHGVADIYTYFYARGLGVLRTAGRFAMITSNKYMRSNYGAPLRGFLQESARLEQIIDFGELPLFEEAATFPVIVVAARAAPGGDVRFTQVKSLDFSDLNHVTARHSVLLGHSSFEGTSWSLGGADAAALLRKLESKGEPLKDYLARQGVSIRRGVLTGYNAAFVIDKATRERLVSEDPRSAEIIKPLIVGDDVRRYHVNYKDTYLIWTYIGVPIQEYPAVFRHLEQFQPKLEARWDKGKHWWELRACDYYADFEKPKIVYPDIAMSPRFCLDRMACFVEATAFEIPLADFYLLALLNSKLLFCLVKSLTPVLGEEDRGGRFRFKSVYLHQLPIPHRESARNVSGTLTVLADEALRLNNERQVEEQRFLRDLSRLLQTPVESLSGKTKLLGFSDQTVCPDWAAFRAVLMTNGGKLRSRGFDPAGSGMAQLETLFNASRARITPIRQRCAEIDREIDQLVYQLYDLTPEEIALVEGRG